MPMEMTPSADPLTNILKGAFATLHKRALGIATGLTAGLVLFAATAFHVVARPQDAPNIGLLAQYLYGYEVSWQGALIGLW
jgi:hypothetical protein